MSCSYQPWYAGSVETADNIICCTRPCPAQTARAKPDFHFKKNLSNMFRTLLKSKIHRAVVTHCELNYEGSCAIDEDLLDAANICDNEQVHIWNINNGERFVTYAIRAQRGSRIISVNGSAARRAAVGDLVIIATFAQIDDAQCAAFSPQLVFITPDNRIQAQRSTIPVQMP